MTKMCCICNRTQIENSWEVKPTTSGEIVSHGFCPDCYEKQHKVFGSFLKKQLQTNKEI